MRRIRSDAGELRVQVVEGCGQWAVAIERPGHRGFIVNARLLSRLQAALEDAAESIRTKQATGQRPAHRLWIEGTD